MGGILGRHNASANTTAADYLTINDMIAAEQQVPGIKEASPVLNMHQRMVVGSGKEREILVLGVDVNTSGCGASSSAREGSSISRIHSPATKSRWLRKTWRADQFGTLDAALGQTVKIQEVPFVIIGTFRESVDTLGRSEIEDDTVLIPYTVARSMTGTPAVNQIYFSMYDSSSIPAATQSMQEVIAVAPPAGVGVQRQPT